MVDACAGEAISRSSTRHNSEQLRVPAPAVVQVPVTPPSWHLHHGPRSVWKVYVGTWQCTCQPLPLRRSTMCQVLAALLALLVFVQMVSCGMFFCVRLPAAGRSYAKYVDLTSEVAEALPAAHSAAAAAAAAAVAAQDTYSTPKLIPRIIHQTYHSQRLPRSIKHLTRSWREKNGDKWQVRFYDDAACLNFVRQEFPEYLEAYQFLPKDVERADFFRYMVLLRTGGVYADTDVECMQPLDKLIQPTDTMVVGWEGELPSPTATPDPVAEAALVGGAEDVEQQQEAGDTDGSTAITVEAAAAPAATAAAADGGAPSSASSSHNTTQAAPRQHYARRRQLLQWFFAAAPGHPALRELCDHVARNAMNSFSNDTVRDTLERTGQGVWTDVVLRHALKQVTGQSQDPWRVRIMPRVAFGLHPSSAEAGGTGRPPLKEVVVVHHAQGRWQEEVPWSELLLPRKVLRMVAPWALAARPHPMHQAPPPREVDTQLYPVSISHEPPFTMFTRLSGLGDLQAGGQDADVVLTAYGTWQPGLAATRRPSVVQAVVGALAQHQDRHKLLQPAPQQEEEPAAGKGMQGAEAQEQQAAGQASPDPSPGFQLPVQQQQHWQQGMLVDVGAGSGFFSLAAAAGGHPVLAFETSPDSLEAFNASIQYNGFQQLISVFTTPLGAASQQVCVSVDSDFDRVQQQQQQQQQGYAATYSPRGSGSRVLVAVQETAAGGGGKLAASQAATAAAAKAGVAGGVDPMAAAWNLTSWRAAREARLRVRRGYAHRSDGVPLPGSPACRHAVQRATLSDVLGTNAWVAALRIAAHGHEGWVLEGALPYLTKVHRPAAVYLEFCPAAMRAAGYADPQRVLELLHGLGYTDAAHAGHACDMRWGNVTRSLRAGYARLSGVLHQPTWCKLRQEHWRVLLQHAHPNVPENLLLVHRPQVPGDGALGAGAKVGRPARGTTTANGISSSRSRSSTGGRSSSSRTAAAGAAAGDTVLPFVPNRWAHSKAEHMHLHVVRHKHQEQQKTAAGAADSGGLQQVPSSSGSGGALR